MGQGNKPNTELTIEQKITTLRIAHGATQKDLAQALDCGLSTVQRVEKGERTYTKQELEMAIKYFGVEGVPLTEKEVADYKFKIYVWRDRIKANLLEEARKLQKELSFITACAKVDFLQDLVILYKALEVRLLLKYDDFDNIKKNLDFVEQMLDITTEENKYHFYFSSGSLHLYTKNNKEALRYYSLALDVDSDDFEKETSLHFNIALCHAEHGRYFLAITSLERIYNQTGDDITSTFGMLIDSNLGLNYMRMGHTEYARELLNKALEKARGVGNETFVGFILHNYGCSCLKPKEHKKAIEYFDKASVYFTKGSISYLENLYFKIRCLIGLKNSMAEEMINQALEQAKENEHYSTLFGSLSHLLTLNEKTSAQYIEEKTIPYLSSRFEFFKALDYCELLMELYDKKGLKIKYLEVMAMAYDINNKMNSGRDW